MSFPRPFSGVFTFQGTIPSAAMNVLNENFSKALDKTGDQITGNIELVAPDGYLGVQGGASIVIGDGGVLECVDNSEIFIGDEAFLEVSGVVAMNNLSLFEANSGSLVRVKSGSKLKLDNGSITEIDGYEVFTSGSTLRIEEGTTYQAASFPTFITANSRQICQNVIDGSSFSGSWTLGMQFTTSNSVGSQWVIPLDRCHNGATLNQIQVQFAVGGIHSGVPAALPSFQVYRYKYTDIFTPESLSSTAVQSPSIPGSGSLWYDSGNQKTFSFLCNQNNVIDNTQYIYTMLITDESGANSVSGNSYSILTYLHLNINDQSWNT